MAVKTKEVWLVWREFPGTSEEFVARARHENLAGAKGQAEEDLRNSKQILRIENDDGKVLWEPK